MSAIGSSPVTLWLVSYLFNALWQIPLVFAAAWSAARLLRRAGAQAEHRLWVSALLAQVALPACVLPGAASWPALRYLLPWLASAAADGHVRVLSGPGVAVSAAVRLPALLIAGIALVYGCTLACYGGSVACGLWQTVRLRRAATPVTLAAEAAQRYSRICRRLAIAGELPPIAAAPRCIGPLTAGVGRGLILLPDGFVESASASELDAVLAHEAAHIARCDFAKNLCCTVIALPAAWHPLLWWTRSRLTESRELVCDARAAEVLSGRRQYARSLLRLAAIFAERSPIHIAAAIAMLSFPTGNRVLERRIMSLTRKPVFVSPLRRLTVAAACCALALATGASALAGHTSIDSGVAASPSTTARTLNVKPEIVARNKISGETPAYPPDARAKKIQGMVVLDATIGKDGVVRNLRVLRSPDKLLSKSSLDAVRTWRYRPYLLNGDPVEVKTTIHVIYNLGG